MTSIHVSVCEAQAQAVKTGKLTVGMVGVSVSFSFDEAWEGLKRIAVFRCGDVTRDRSLILSNETTVPYEVLQKAEERLMIGVEGRGEDGSLVIPTTWADAGVVMPGANATGEHGKEPSPNAYDDIMSAIQSGILRGPEGPKGDKPIKGVDYYTPSEQAELVTAVLNAADAAVDTCPAIVCEASGELVSVDDASGWALKDLHIYGKTTLSAAPDPYEPADLVNAGNAGSIGITVTGKNLFGGDALGDEIKNRGGTKDESTGTATFNPGILDRKIPLFDKFKENTRYTFILYGHNSAQEGVTNLLLRYADGSAAELYFNNGKLGTACPPNEFGYIFFTTTAGKTVSSLNFSWQNGVTTLQYDKCGIFEGAISLDEFEAYNAQTMTVDTPNSLPGIPVSAGGNYTDSDGQQWICDEIDFVRGVYVKRVANMEFDGSEDETWEGLYAENGSLYGYQIKVDGIVSSDASAMPVCLSNRYPAKSADTFAPGEDGICIQSINGVSYVKVSAAEHYNVGGIDWRTDLEDVPLVCLFQIEDPEEIALSAEALAAFAALHTYKLHTKVRTDSNAGIKLKYIADTKSYIDNKFLQLTANSSEV